MNPKLKRRFRLQLSLRMLLALTAVIGVALAIFFWPWVEIKSHDVMGTQPVVDPFTDGPPQPKLLFRYEVRTTFRRNWRAQPVKNGPQQTWRDGRLWHEARFYDGELNGPRHVFNERGELVFEINYRNGMRNGSYRVGDGSTWHWDGTYRDDVVDGKWRVLCPKSWAIRQMRRPNLDYFFDHEGSVTLAHEWLQFSQAADLLVVESQWNQGERQGLTTWKTAQGELLHTAEYDQDQLVTWNGEPVVEQLRQWLIGPEVNDPQLAALLFANYELVQSQNRFAGDAPTLADELPLMLQPIGQPPQHLVIHVARLGTTRPLDGDLEVAPVGPQLCERAGFHGYGFQYRYGGLWLVPRADPQPPFVDPTGVSQIEFPPKSKEAGEWDEVIDIPEMYDHEAGCVNRLLGGTSIAMGIELADRPQSIELDELDRVAPFPLPPPLFRRSRRHAIGYVLYRSGCRCELRAGKLIILSESQRTQKERNSRPLSLSLGIDPFR